MKTLSACHGRRHRGGRTRTPGAVGRRAASRVVFAAGASESPLLEDRRQLHPGGRDKEEEPEKGQEYYGKSAVTVTAVHGELLVGASGLGNNEPGGRLVLCGRLPPLLSASGADETALARRRFRVNREKGTGGSARVCMPLTTGAPLPLARASSP